MRSHTRFGPGAVRPRLGAAVTVLAVAAVVAAARFHGSLDAPSVQAMPAREMPAAPRVDGRAARRSPARLDPKRIRWRRSIAVGSPSAGRLVRGVQLPAQHASFFTWDPVLRRSPNRRWRRWGTDRLVRMLITVAREYRAAHPDAPRVAIGDLSRPRGSDFGVRFGPIGHASHQNGLDADVYYPRADRRERAPRYASQIDRRLSQELVDRCLAEGAQVIFIGPHTGLSGPPGRVQALANHDNHFHVRLAARSER